MYVLPTLEYGAVVWSSGISKNQSQRLERVQKRALRIIAYPHLLPYTDLLCKFNMQELSIRRVQLITKFAQSLLTSSRNHHFLPLTRQMFSDHLLRNSNRLDIPYCRTQRK